MILLCLLYVMFKSSFKVPRSFSQASCGGGGGVHSLLNLSSNVDSHVPACYLSQSFTTFFQGFLLFALMSSGILIFDHITWIMKWNNALNEFHSLTNACCCMLSHFSHVWLFVILWTVARRAPLSMGFSRQGYRSGLPCPPLGDLPDPKIEPQSLSSPALAGGFFTTSATWEAQCLLLALNNY